MPIRLLAASLAALSATAGALSSYTPIRLALLHHSLPVCDLMIRSMNAVLQTIGMPSNGLQQGAHP